MSETQSDHWGGWKSQERTSDPAVHAGWRERHTYNEKTAIMTQLAIACKLGTRLVQHWLRHDRLNKEAVEFFDACGYIYTHDIPAHLLTGTVLDDWYEHDWRGKKGQAPTASQLFERALMTTSRLEGERIAEQYRAPAVKRVVDLDSLPALYGADAFAEVI